MYVETMDVAKDITVENIMNKVTELFFSFAKIGIFTFGGGYAMISVIENCCVDKKKWITHDEMMDIAVIAESTPGPIAINCATFVGYKIAGVLGAVFSTLGVVLPSFAIILVISTILDDFLSIPLVANAFTGIKVGVGLLILNAGITMLKKMSSSVFARIILGVSFAIMMLVNLLSLNFSSIAMMLIAGVVSIIYFLINEMREDKTK